MHPAIFVAAFATYSYAQNLDLDAIAQADPIPTPEIPVVYSTSFDYAIPAATLIAETVAYDASAAAASASAEVAADLSEAQPTNVISKRDDASCTALQAKFGSIYTTSKNVQYTVMCGFDYSGYDLAAVSGSSFANCYDKCDGYPGCVSFSFVGGSGAGTCYLKRRGANTAKANGGVSGGALSDMPTLAANLCVAQPTGISHTSDPDTDVSFLNDLYYSQIASVASPPTGYSEAFKDKQGSNNALGYLGFSLMSTYDTSVCASRCNKVNGCQAINIYFERDPSVDPNDSSCADPKPSYTQIKCVYWGGPVTQSNLLNFGQYRNKFHVVIAGSNGYVNKSIDTPAGYTGPSYLGNSVISAPETDCAGYSNRLKGYLWATGPFDAGRCAAACSAYNGNPPASGVAQTCQFFNTYMLKANGKDAGQYCALYQQSFPSSSSVSSTNVDGVTYTFGYSYTFTNVTSAGGPAVPCAVASASRIIGASTLQGFCSTLLGFNAPTSTATVVVSPITTILSTIIPDASTVVSTSTTTTFVATSTYVPAKRAEQLQTPAALSFPASVVSAACSLQASKATSTILTTTTSTASAVFFTSLTTAAASISTITVTNTVKATATANPNGCTKVDVCVASKKVKTYDCKGQGSEGLCACGTDAKGANVCYASDKCTKSCDTTTDCKNFGTVPMVCVFNTCCNNNGSASSGKGNCMPVSTYCMNAGSPSRMFKRGERKFGTVAKRQDTTEGECTALSCPDTWVDETTGVVVQGIDAPL
ncbi:hypothetical protein E4T47_03678 [Aureobasidium subglaciale]|nr:hypothetical protein E4T47_03678 [Aureobasidium subglaciale]